MYSYLYPNRVELHCLPHIHLDNSFKVGKQLRFSHLTGFVFESVESLAELFHLTRVIQEVFKGEALSHVFKIFF